MRESLAAILGEYTPSGTGIAGVDYEYIFAGIVFCICLYYTFSILKSIFCCLMSRRW